MNKTFSNRLFPLIVGVSTFVLASLLLLFTPINNSGALWNDNTPPTGTNIVNSGDMNIKVDWENKTGETKIMENCDGKQFNLSGKPVIASLGGDKVVKIPVTITSKAKRMAGTIQVEAIEITRNIIGEEPKTITLDNSDVKANIETLNGDDLAKPHMYSNKTDGMKAILKIVIPQDKNLNQIFNSDGTIKNSETIKNKNGKYNYTIGTIKTTFKQTKIEGTEQELN